MQRSVKSKNARIGQQIKFADANSPIGRTYADVLRRKLAKHQTVINP